MTHISLALLGTDDGGTSACARTRVSSELVVGPSAERAVRPVAVGISCLVNCSRRQLGKEEAFECNDDINVERTSAYIEVSSYYLKKKKRTPMECSTFSKKNEHPIRVLEHILIG